MSKSVELARKMATVAPAGQRLGGPGTRSKNPKRYDAHPKGAAKIGAERKKNE